MSEFLIVINDNAIGQANKFSSFMRAIQRGASSIKALWIVSDINLRENRW